MVRFYLNLSDNILSGFRLVRLYLDSKWSVDRVVDIVLDTMYKNHCQILTFRIYVSDSCLISLQITEQKTKLRFAIFIWERNTVQTSVER